MKLFKIGEKTINLDLLAYYEEITGSELRPDYEPELDADDQPIDPAESDYRPTLRVELHFSGKDKPLRLDQDESREFLDHVSQRYGVNSLVGGLPQQENPEG